MSGPAAAVAGARAAFDRGVSRPLAWRRAQLEALIALLTRHEQALADALRADLHKPFQEAWITELAFVAGEARHALKHLRHWTRARRVATPLVGQPARSRIVPEPLGVVLVMGAWNYPLQGVLDPLVSVLAAGNTAVLKPSELAPQTSALLAELLPQHLDADAIRVVTGGVEVAQPLLAERFDHICYTGGGAVGRIVMAAAAQHLTPVTLELGGKSPVLILPDTNLTLAARRIAWGKWMNAGQTCLAPDYVLVGEAQREPLIAALREAVVAMYGSDARRSPDYGRIVSTRHTARVAGYLGDGDIRFGGEVDLDQRYIAPTVLTVSRTDTPLMREEIFGPLLPIVTVADMGEAAAFVRGRDKPLALYVFGRDGAVANALAEALPAGQVCINDVLMFTTVSEFPFGGVGASGMGRYRGSRGFENFSHLKPVMQRANWLDLAARYAPFTPAKLRLLRWVR